MSAKTKKTVKKTSPGKGAPRGVRAAQPRQARSQARKLGTRLNGRQVVFMAAFAMFAMALTLSFWQRTPDLPSPGLKQLAADRGVTLSMLTYPEHLESKPWTNVLNSQFSGITIDGHMHWDKIRPTPDRYDLKAMDTIVNYAEAHNLKVQAHHLTWNEDDSLPRWIKQGGYSREQLMAFMKDHIDTIMHRYKGRVAEYTVVNEAFSRIKHPWGLDNWWGDQLGGTEYIDQAFRWAKAADPDAKLILNDFDNEVENEISNNMYYYMKSARERGVPIDGIGMQLHVYSHNPPSKDAMVKNMRRFGELGYKVYITEFDIISVHLRAGHQEKLRVEAQIAHDVARACVEAGNCASFTVFGMPDKPEVVDKITKNRRPRSHLFDPRFQPKPEFYRFREAWRMP